MKKFNFIYLLITLVFTWAHYSHSHILTEEFSFIHNGKRYVGLIDLPKDKRPSSLIVLIPGDGKTNVVKDNWYFKTRSKFINMGIACCIWDKAGCGKSDGKYIYNQPIESSANEALSAIKKIRKMNIVDSDKIGLWGISRAGWICPLIIKKDKSIAFWISVSGTDKLDNYRYLLESNLRIEGRTESEIKVILKEWDFLNKYQRGGKDYKEFIDSTKHLFQDSLCKKLGLGVDNKEEYNSFVEYYKKSNFIYDKKTGLQIMVTGFENILKNVNCPVLAICGEKDSQVNWKNTINLYRKTINKNKNATLTIKTLPNCNHNMNYCKTGGLFEDLSYFKWKVNDAYYETMTTWIQQNGFNK